MKLSTAALRQTGLIAMLLGITVIWGWTFLIVKDAVSSYPVLDFLALRFLIAALVLSPFAFRPSLTTLGVGAFIGSSLALGYLCQTVGLMGTSAANAGLLTGLFVILTPIFDWLFYRGQVAPATILAIVIGFAGTVLLTFTGGHGPTWGDGLEVLTAVAFAIQILWLGRYARGHSSMQLAFAQMLPAAGLFVVLAAATTGTTFQAPAAWVWFAIVLTGAIASALAFWVQTFVQQRMAPARTALILLGEPAFAALFAVWLGGERLGPIQWTGAALIFLSLIAHEGWVASTRVGQ